MVCQKIHAPNSNGSVIILWTGPIFRAAGEHHPGWNLARISNMESPKHVPNELPRKMVPSGSSKSMANCWGARNCPSSSSNKSPEFTRKWIQLVADVSQLMLDG